MQLTTIADSVTRALPCCDDPPLAIARYARRPVRVLAGQDAADEWLRDRPGTTALTLDEAFELGRHVTRPLLAAR